MDMHLIWVSPERKYFCKKGWTAELPRGPSGKSVDLSAGGVKPAGLPIEQPD
jgi:hypothetical protein